eukprot:8736142-Alexandrium_andersonii.AAC.1
MVCLQTLQTELTATAQREHYDSLKHFRKPEPEDRAVRQLDADPQDANEPDSEEAWRTMAEARW